MVLSKTLIFAFNFILLFRTRFCVQNDFHARVVLGTKNFARISISRYLCYRVSRYHPPFKMSPSKKFSRSPYFSYQHRTFLSRIFFFAIQLLSRSTSVTDNISIHDYLHISSSALYTCVLVYDLCAGVHVYYTR